MNNEAVNEILKAFAYEIPINKISENTGILEKELSKFRDENKDSIEAIKKYYKEMEGWSCLCIMASTFQNGMAMLI